MGLTFRNPVKGIVENGVIHVIMVGDGLDLRQVEGGQPDDGGHKYTF